MLQRAPYIEQPYNQEPCVLGEPAPISTKEGEDLLQSIASHQTQTKLKFPSSAKGIFTMMHTESPVKTVLNRMEQLQMAGYNVLKNLNYYHSNFAKIFIEKGPEIMIHAC